jgi:hypothetical protein
VAVRAQSNHLRGIVGAALGQVVDVVDFQDRVAAVGLIIGPSGATRVLALARAANQYGVARLSGAQ